MKKPDLKSDEKNSHVDNYTDKLPENGKFFGFENVRKILYLIHLAFCYYVLCKQLNVGIVPLPNIQRSYFKSKNSIKS